MSCVDPVWSLDLVTWLSAAVHPSNLCWLPLKLLAHLPEGSHVTHTTPASLYTLQAHACIGGKSVGDDIRKLENGVHIVSGTPGRVFDMIKRRSLRTR